MNRLLIVFTVAGLLIWVSSQQSDDLEALVADGETFPDIRQEFALVSSDTINDASTSPVISNAKEPVSKDQVVNIGPDLPPPGIEYIAEASNRFIHFSDVVSIGEDISVGHIDRESYFL